MLTNASTLGPSRRLEQVGRADDVGAEDRGAIRLPRVGAVRGEVEDPLGARRPRRPSRRRPRRPGRAGRRRAAPSSSASRQQSEPGPVRSVGSYPSSSRRRATFAPMKPAAPVTMTRFTAVLPVTPSRRLVACPTLDGTSRLVGRLRPRPRASGLGARGALSTLSTMYGGPALDLVVDVREVRADDGEAEELDPAEEEDHDEERREALRRERGIDEPKHDLRQCRDDREADRDERQPRDQVERRVREREDGATRPLEVPDERVGRRAVRSLGPDVRDAGLAKADPGAQAADEPVGLGQLVQGVDHAPVEQGEVAGVEGDRDVRRRPEQAIERLVGDPHRAAS